MSSPLGWRITSDKSGFFIENEYGEDLTPGWRAVTWAGAQVKLTNMAREAFDNLDGRDPPGWEGGFADNH